MARLSDLLTGAVAGWRRFVRRSPDHPVASPPTPTAPAHVDSPGRSGTAATTDVDPAGIGRVAMSYSPRTDGEPDPGEVIWTWV
ncbi:MAG: type II toxin-antitoxin system PemK/MazF family toxin, partial [Nakamurella sp.]